MTARHVLNKELPNAGLKVLVSVRKIWLNFAKYNEEGTETQSSGNDKLQL